MSAQPSLFDAPPSYTGPLDGKRLSRLLSGVQHCLKAGGWWTLSELRLTIGHGSEAGISARIREWRGMGATINRRRRGDPRRGLWEYAVGGQS